MVMLTSPEVAVLDDSPDRLCPMTKDFPPCPLAPFIAHLTPSAR